MTSYIPVKLYDHQISHAKIIHYPDGQRDVELDLQYFNNPKIPVQINCSIKNYSDLELLYSLLSALHCSDFIVDEINFYYLFGARSDRRFKTGGSSYFRDVIAPLINALSGRKRFLNLHGRSLKFIKVQVLHDYLFFNGEIIDGPSKIALAGDESAYGLTLAITGDCSHHRYMAFHKKRDNECVNVSLTSAAEKEIRASAPQKPILIVDDLCDGGATFIAEADYLKEKFPERKLHLFVVHGLFTKGLDELAKRFERIYCTNSYQNIDHPQVTQIKVI